MSTFGTICLIGAGAWVAYLVWAHFIRPNPGDGKGGFFDFVKNPGMFSGPSAPPPGQVHPLPESQDPEEWDAAVRSAIDQRWHTPEYRRLSERSPMVVQSAIRLMKEQEYVGKPWPKSEHGLNSWNLTAFERLLDQVIPVDVMPCVVPFLSHDDEWCRKTAGEMIGRIDYPEAAEVIRKCLNGDDKDVIAGVIMGMTHVVHKRRGNDGLLLLIWDDLLNSIIHGKIDAYYLSAIIERMVQADKDKAKHIFTSDNFLHKDHNLLDSIMLGLRKSGLPCSKSKATEFLNYWRNRAIEDARDSFRRNSIIGECLMAIVSDKNGEVDHEERKLVDELINDEDKTIASTACPAFLAMHGITIDPGSVCWEIVYERNGILSKEQRAYWEVYLFRNEVSNGGWHQYFVNTSGDGWKHCLDAFSLMGLAAIEKEFRKAVDLFGPQGPDVNRDKRWGQLSQFPKHKDSVLEGLPFRSDDIEVALAKFAVLHRDEFTPLPPLKVPPATRQ